MYNSLEIQIWFDLQLHLTFTILEVNEQVHTYTILLLPD